MTPSPHSLDDARAYAQKDIELDRARQGGSLAPMHLTSCPSPGRGRAELKARRSNPSSKAKGPTSHRTQKILIYVGLALFALALIPASVQVYASARELQAVGGQK